MTYPVATSFIAAQAFRELELSPISSFGDESPEAADAAALFPVAMQACLERCDWGFASRTVALPQIADLPEGTAADPDLPYAYALPGDCVMLREVGPEGTRYRRDMAALLADAPAPLAIRYTALIQNEEALPATFRLAVATALAVLMAPRWLVTQSKRANLEQTAEIRLKSAMTHDARTASGRRYERGAPAADWAGWAMR